MRLELSESLVRRVRQLILINIDNNVGFQIAAQLVENTDLIRFFLRLAWQRDELGKQLKRYVELDNQTDPESDGMGRTHLWWLGLRAKLNPGNPLVVLHEAAKGQDRIETLYHNLINDPESTPLDHLLKHQYETIRKGHRQIIRYIQNIQNTYLEPQFDIQFDPRIDPRINPQTCPQMHPRIHPQTLPQKLPQDLPRFQPFKIVTDIPLC